MDAAGGVAAAAPAPVPPCIVLLPGGAGVILDLTDRASATGLVKIRPDVVLAASSASVANPKCNDELLDFLARALAVRRSTLAVRTF